jgi:hypothetical protein
MSIISTSSNLGMAISTYITDGKNEPALAATWAKGNGQVQADTTYFQSKAPKLTSVDALMKDYRSLKVVLGAYNVSGLLTSPALVRQLLTQDPTSASSAAQKIRNPAYQNFAKAFAQFQNNPLGSAGNVSAIVKSYVTNAYEAAQGTQTPGMQNALAFKRVASQITTVAQLMSNPAALSVAVVKLGIDFVTYGSMSYAKQVSLVTNKIKLSDFQNPKKVDTIAEQYLLQSVNDPTSWNAAPSNGNTVASLLGAGSSTSLLSLFT